MAQQINYYDEVISSMLIELDNDHSTYQKLYEKYYGKQDDNVIHIHSMLTSLCQTIRKKMHERK